MSEVNIIHCMHVNVMLFWEKHYKQTEYWKISNPQNGANWTWIRYEL